MVASLVVVGIIGVRVLDRDRHAMRDRFAHVPARNPLDLLTQFDGRAGEELPVKLLHLSGAVPSGSQNLVRRR